MKNNLYQWSMHHRDYLVKYHILFNDLLESYGEGGLSYIEFVHFCYRNTKKSVIYLPGVLSKELYAPLS